MPGVEYTPLVAIVLLPLAGAVLALIAGIWNLRRTGWFFAFLGAVGGTAMLAYLVSVAYRDGAFPVRSVIGGWSPTTGIIVALTQSDAVLGMVIYGIALLILVYAAGERRYGAVFAGIFCIALAAMGGVTIAGDLFNLFVFFEILSLCAVILIAYERRGHALYAALRYLLVGTVSVTFYLVGLLLLYRVTGELAVERIVHRLTETGGNRVAVIGISCIVGAIATRVAIVPFHGWLPAAHGQAPTPVSAFLSGLMLKSGLLALWRVSVIARVSTPALLETMVLLGAVSAVVGAFMAFTQDDVKRLLAFSSISQMGFVVAALGAGANDAALYHAVAHAVFKSMLFLVVGLAVARHGTHNLERLRPQPRPRGWKRLKGRNERGSAGLIETTLLFLGVAAVIGVPGLSGFAGKQLVSAGIRAADPLAYQVLKLASVGTIATFLRLALIRIPSRRERGRGLKAELGTKVELGTKAETLTERIGFPRALPLVVLGAAVIGQGLFRVDLVQRSAVLEFLILLLAGVALVGASRLKMGDRVLARIAQIRFGIDGVLVLVFTGFILLLR